MSMTLVSLVGRDIRTGRMYGGEGQELERVIQIGVVCVGRKGGCVEERSTSWKVFQMIMCGPNRCGLCQ